MIMRFMATAMKIGFLLIVSISIGTVAVTGIQDCENPTNGGNSCGQGTFWNETDKTCIPCPPYYYQDSSNHNCEECKPCSPCEEGWKRADPDGCPTDQDATCVPADQAPDVTVTTVVGSTINGRTEAPAGGTNQTKSSSSTPAQPLGRPEIKKISHLEIKLEFSAAGGQQLIVEGKNFTKDCEVKVMEFSDDGSSVWNGTCAMDKNLFHDTCIVCTMPPYKDNYLQQPAIVYLGITCEGGHSQLMDHPVTYIPVPRADNQEQKDYPWNIGLLGLGIFVGSVFTLLLVLVAVKLRQLWKKKNDQHVAGNQNGNQRGGQDGSGSGSGHQGNGQQGQDSNETELSNLVNGHAGTV